MAQIINQEQQIVAYINDKLGYYDDLPENTLIIPCSFDELVSDEVKEKALEDIYKAIKKYRKYKKTHKNNCKYSQ